MYRRNYATTLLPFLLFTGLWTALAIALKVTAANAAAYTSDLYDYHQALQSTAQGSFFRSYAFGNIMGDHGYLVLFLLIPVYLFSPPIGFWALVVATPLVMAFSAILIRMIMVKRAYLHPNLLAATLLLFPGVWWLTHEPLYGFHPDTLAAPLFALTAVGLAGQAHRSFDAGDRIAVVAFTAFAMLKEEMAVLGILFAIPFILKPVSRRYGLSLTIISALSATTAFGVMALFNTPFNRGNSNLIGEGIGRIFPWPGLPAAFPVLVPLVVGGLLVTATIIAWRRLDTVEAAVALVVAAKIASLALVWDHLPSFSWHLAIPLAGAWLVVLRLLRTAAKSNLAPVVIALTAMVIGLVGIDGRWLVSYQRVLDERAVNAAEAANARRAFAPYVETGVVSVLPFDLHAWRDHASNVLPRGLTLSPKGVSDYVVTGSDGLPSDVEPFQTCLMRKERTSSRILYVRVGDCPFAEERQLFDQLVGLP